MSYQKRKTTGAVEQNFYLTTVATSQENGYYINEASQNNSIIATRLGTDNFSTRLSVNKITASRSSAFQQLLTTTSPYNVFVVYEDSNSPPQYYGNLVVSLPWSAGVVNGAIGQFPAVPLYLGGNSTSTYKYQVGVSQFGLFQFIVSPNGTVGSGDLPQQAWIIINAYINTYNPFLGKASINNYLFTSFNIYPNVPVPLSVASTIWQFTLPPWLDNPFHVQSVYAAAGSANSNLTNILAAAPFVVPFPGGIFTPPTLTVLANINPLLWTYCSLSDNTPEAQPSSVVQVELSIVDFQFAGNQTSGRLLWIFTLNPPSGAQSSLDIETFFETQSRQYVSNAGQQPQWNVSFLDYNGNLFQTLLTGWDFTILVRQLSETQ
jgi:hypothetical protein